MSSTRDTQVAGRTQRSAVQAIDRPAGTALCPVRPTDSTSIRSLDKALVRLSQIGLNDPIQLAWMVKQMES